MLPLVIGFTGKGKCGKGGYHTLGKGKGKGKCSSPTIWHVPPSHRSRTLVKGTIVFIDCDNYSVQWTRRVQDSIWWFVSEVPK